MIRHLFIILLILTLTACGERQVKTPSNAMNKFEQFKNKEKFVEDSVIFYPGVEDKAMKPILTKKINLAADDFHELSLTNKATEKDYQDKIEFGLKRFSDLYENLDTEDKERICHYFEELMDIVGLESSGGHLNDFMYSFDPTK